MIKNIAWNTFKNTGNIDTFLEFRQIKDIENGQKITTDLQNSNAAKQALTYIVKDEFTPQ